jgi:hypothetical protein
MGMRAPWFSPTETHQGLLEHSEFGLVSAAAGNVGTGLDELFLDSVLIGRTLS